MAFNLARYDLNPFNIGAQSELYLTVYGSEKITPVTGFSSQVYLTCEGQEQVTKSIIGYSGRYIDGSAGLETINEEVIKGELSVILFPRFSETVGAQITRAADIRPSVSGLESISGQTDISASVFIPAKCYEIISANTALGMDLTLDVTGYELVNESASVIDLDSKTCNLTVTLKPGQKLVIDASTYTVLLDGENAIELQSGDWIDELDRETTDISILAATGTANLTASITYLERYL